jgi:hypothetical protein
MIAPMTGILLMNLVIPPTLAAPGRALGRTISCEPETTFSIRPAELDAGTGEVPPRLANGPPLAFAPAVVAGGFAGGLPLPLPPAAVFGAAVVFEAVGAVAVEAVFVALGGFSLNCLRLFVVASPRSLWVSVFELLAGLDCPRDLRKDRVSKSLASWVVMIGRL